MKKYKHITTLVLSIFFISILSATACANSSWHWISDTRPYDVLPFVVVGTLLIETAAVNYIPKIHKLFKVFCVISLGNLLSYMVPWAFRYFVPYAFGTFHDSIEHGPVYNIGLAYLFLTVVVELPVEYFLLKNDSMKKTKLALTIILANVATTSLVAVVERIVCAGEW
jgi:hypothetical protein